MSLLTYFIATKETYRLSRLDWHRSLVSLLMSVCLFRCVSLFWRISLLQKRPADYPDSIDTSHLCLFWWVHVSFEVYMSLLTYFIATKETYRLLRHDWHKSLVSLLMGVCLIWSVYVSFDVFHRHKRDLQNIQTRLTQVTCVSFDECMSLLMCLSLLTDFIATKETCRLSTLDWQRSLK